MFWGIMALLSLGYPDIVGAWSWGIVLILASQSSPAVDGTSQRNLITVSGNQYATISFCFQQ